MEMEEESLRERLLERVKLSGNKKIKDETPWLRSEQKGWKRIIFYDQIDKRQNSPVHFYTSCVLFAWKSNPFWIFIKALFFHLIYLFRLI